MVALCPAINAGQMIGSAKSQAPKGEEEMEKVTNLLSKLGEQLTTQRLNLRQAACDETATLEVFPAKGGTPTRTTRSFHFSAERKAADSFTSEAQLIETHTPVDAAKSESGPPAAGATLDDSALAKDSFSAAPEFLGMDHSDAYVQTFLRKEKMDDRPAFLVAFQTVKQMEERRILIQGKEVPMRMKGQFWIDAATGRLLRLQVQQTKLPKGVKEFSYDISYPPPTAAPSFTLPGSVRFVRNFNGETEIIMQTFSNCRVN